MINNLIKQSEIKKNLIFDFDKTIAQIEIDWSKWHDGISAIFAEFDKHHGYKAGLDPHKFYNELVDKYGDSLVRKVQSFVSDYEEEFTLGFTPYQELVEFIKNNNTNNLYIYSSNARKTVESGLADLDILKSFQNIVSRDDVRKIKPEPEGFKQLGIQDDVVFQTLMIGDSSSDELAANAVGIDFLKCTFFGTYIFNKD